MTYYRWVVCHGNARPNDPGIFDKAIEIWKTYENEGTIEEHRTLHRALMKFNHYVDVPKRVPQHGIFWFKENTECLDWAREMAHAMNRLKVKTAHFTSEKPGKILYEDKHQIIAVYNGRARCRKMD